MKCGCSRPKEVGHASCLVWAAQEIKKVSAVGGEVWSTAQPDDQAQWLLWTGWRLVHIIPCWEMLWLPVLRNGRFTRTKLSKCRSVESKIAEEHNQKLLHFKASQIPTSSVPRISQCQVIHALWGRNLCFPCYPQYWCLPLQRTRQKTEGTVAPTMWQPVRVWGRWHRTPISHTGMHTCFYTSCLGHWDTHMSSSRRRHRGQSVREGSRRLYLQWRFHLLCS